MPLEGLIVLMKPSVTRDAEDSPKMEEAAPVAEKQGEQNENKDNKDATANEEEEKEEDKVTTYLVLSTFKSIYCLSDIVCPIMMCCVFCDMTVVYA